MTNRLNVKYFIACLVATNATTWVLSGKFKNSDFDKELPVSENVAASTSVKAIANTKTHSQQSELILPKTAAVDRTHQKNIAIDSAQKESDSLKKSLDTQPSPLTKPPADIPDNLLDEDASFQVSDVNGFNKDSFEYDSNEQKLKTLKTLSSNGDDLEFVRQVAISDNDPEIKIAAIKKLSGVNNYAAVNTLVASIEDKSPEVAVTALTALVATNDRSLLPMLKNKYVQFEDGAIKTQLSQAIQTLEYTPAFSMDAEY